MYRVNSIRLPAPTLKVIHVFTHKDLEASTINISETNVLGNGGFGAVYRGILSDAATLKMLHRKGKQGERDLCLETRKFFLMYLSFFSALTKKI